MLVHYSFLTASALAWMGSTRVKGANFHPSALKNLLLNSTHCNLNACKKHSIVSIPIMTAKVMLKNKNMPITMVIAFALSIPPPIVFSKNTFESCPWANDKAQRRRYEAVFEIAPNTNSIVSIIWWTAISLMSSWWSPCGFLTSLPYLSAPSYLAICFDFYFIYWLSWSYSFESLNETTKFSSLIFSWWCLCCWWGADFLLWIQRIKGLGMSIHGTQINEIISKLYCRAYWFSRFQSGFPSVDHICKGSAIIWPMIDGAIAVSTSMSQAMVHL